MLIQRRTLESLGRLGKDVLLHDEPADVPHRSQLGEHRVGVEVTLSQRRKSLPGPDLRGRTAARDDLRHHRPSRVLQVDLVDPTAPVADGRHRVASTEDEVAGVKAQSDIGELEHAIDFPWRLDVGTGFMVERRLVAPVAAPLDDLL